MNRRTFIVTSAAGLTGIALAEQSNPPEPIRNLKPMTGGIQPITDDERRARRAHARELMTQNKLGAIVCERGSSAYYYTGAYWSSAAAATPLWIFPLKGDPIWFAPAT